MYALRGFLSSKTFTFRDIQEYFLGDIPVVRKKLQILNFLKKLAPLIMHTQLEPATGVLFTVT